MPYLFQRAVEAALLKDPDKADFKHLKEKCESKTQSLAADFHRINPQPDDMQIAGPLVVSMGEQFKPKNGPWAGTYVDNWRMVSGNAPIVTALVSAQLQQAYELELDISNERVIGKMFGLAVLVWSVLGEYSSPPQEPGRR
ncbi:hypothetical protein VVD49_13655 [Uliginosibacterium sp. H3]|uniref:Uncharacterized protein n=1 Tax=Uliginosibacterium silvisoli TaxID=3114758 RepID=A0ABU6K711_9RHOO|nr:hypothetical protein [Uliginosibacterium sp. H3]